ncbi:IclR family transcriptional regulator [Chelativorans salis]|uniref:IclR family transcriptional regulator n=1 Tax=Chelativorans salis TaxID=2978478 RepID=A0ABT2LJ63_9HYPH|nr:IclR family transcriptional regulator [Chelativorans sp. EGI FJ00035]MCT7374621.1 IclR family transcriptional regulator [Chelativorans sp. EGI FJ00035]
MAKDDNGNEHTGGIQSLDAALRLLNAMIERRAPASLSELARECGMPPSKVHRYLASFHHAGLVEQAGRSGKYDLGPGAVTLGLSALARHDFVNRASDALPDLRDESGLTALLSVWGTQGATVIRWERAASPMVTSMGLGTTLPLLNSATGRAFLAWAPPAPLQAFREAELRHARQNPAVAPDLLPTEEDIDKMVQTIRTQGYASVEGKFIPGLVAIAAPILDWQREAQAVITLIGTDPAVVQPRSEAVERLTAFCKELSFAPMITGGAR